MQHHHRLVPQPERVLVQRGRDEPAGQVGLDAADVPVAEHHPGRRGDQQGDQNGGPAARQTPLAPVHTGAHGHPPGGRRGRGSRLVKPFLIMLGHVVSLVYDYCLKTVISY
ncbi:hypothetical protein GCM10023322_72260 [Rugosimonospora acidiphila]|uniref:Uncharacterized protein n=1 Tax=Rugosimonospora acidiphila TaxID=556531 RepID=A0ABP9SMM7_9ACTN